MPYYKCRWPRAFPQRVDPPGDSGESRLRCNAAATNGGEVIIVRRIGALVMGGDIHVRDNPVNSVRLVSYQGVHP